MSCTSIKYDEKVSEAPYQIYCWTALINFYQTQVLHVSSNVGPQSWSFHLPGWLQCFEWEISTICLLLVHHCMEFIVDPAAQWSIFGVVQKFLTLSGTFAQPLPLLQLPEHLLIILTNVFGNNLQTVFWLKVSCRFCVWNMMKPLMKITPRTMRKRRYSEATNYIPMFHLCPAVAVWVYSEATLQFS